MSTKENYINVMLMDGRNNQYKGRLESLEVGEYIKMAAKVECSGKVTIFDFSPAIKIFHEKINEANKSLEDKAVSLSRSTIYNLWRQIRSAKERDLAVGVASSIIVKSEEVLQLIYTRLPVLAGEFHGNHSGDQYLAAFNRDLAFNKFNAEIDSFFEVLLCRVYMSVKFSFESLSNDDVLIGHCRAIREVVYKGLCRESSFTGGQFGWDSPVYHACVEDIGIDPGAVSYFLGGNNSTEDIRSWLISRGDFNDLGYGRKSISMSFAACDSSKADRINRLCRLLVRIDTLLEMLSSLQGKEFEFDAGNLRKHEFERSLSELLR